MKSVVFICGELLLSISSFGQVLLEDKGGGRIADNLPGSINGANYYAPLIKLNTGEQSLGFDFIASAQNHDPNSYKIHSFGIKAKPTEGYASVFSNGQFSPGIRASYSLVKVRLLAQDPNKKSYLDWGGFIVNYDINKYSLYDPKNTFDKQLYSETVKGISFLLNYNALINNRGILSIRVGYAWKDNYESLTSATINDITTIVDPVANTQRQVVRSKSAKMGSFNSFDAYPIIISYTRATPTDAPGSSDALRLRLGYTVYIKNISAKGYLPKTNPGVLFFLTKQDKNGVRAPLLGLNIQIEDPFDTREQGNGLQSRLTLGFTTVFTI